MTSRIDREAHRFGHGLVLALVLALACSSGGSSSSSAPHLQSLSLSPATSYLATGVTLQLSATGLQTDGTTVPVASGLRWESSDATVATVSDAGLVTALKGGSVTIRATHLASSQAATAAVTARSMVSLNVAASTLPSPGSVDTSRAGYRFTGLTPGAFYLVDVDQMQDDLDLEVYGDASLSDPAQLCVSQTSGLFPEDCVAPANAQGELYAMVDGQWTASGSTFTINLIAQTPAGLDATLAFPAGLPYAGTVTGRRVYRVTGLTAGASYTVGISQLDDDADLEVFADPVLYASLCASSASGTAADSCAAPAGAAGDLYVVVENEGAADTIHFTLGVTAH